MLRKACLLDILDSKKETEHVSGLARHLIAGGVNTRLANGMIDAVLDCF
jgi:hypothetical protein